MLVSNLISGKQKRHFRKSAVVLALGALMAQGANAQANSYPTEWIGGVDDSFYTVANWPAFTGDDFGWGINTLAPFYNTNPDPALPPSWMDNILIQRTVINRVDRVPVMRFPLSSMDLNAGTRFQRPLIVGEGEGKSGRLVIDTTDSPPFPYGPYIPGGGSFEAYGLFFQPDNSNWTQLPDDPDRPGPPSFTGPSPVQIGQDKGTGELVVKLGKDTPLMRGLASVGSTGGNGTMQVLGRGKTPEEVNTGSQAVNWSTQSTAADAFRVGIAGGNGTVTVDGAGLGVYGFTGRTDSMGVGNLLHNGKLIVGSGVGSSGHIDVLGGGKLAVGAITQEQENVYGVNMTRVGIDGGVGSIQIQAKGKNNIYNRANISHGLSLGTKGGVGQLDVLADGKAWVHKPVALQPFDRMAGCPADTYLKRIAPLTISDESADLTDGSKQSWVRVDGANANLLVSGKISFDTEVPDAPVYDVHPGTIGRIEVGSRGGLVAADGGLIQVGAAAATDIANPDPAFVPKIRVNVPRLGPVDVNGSGAVYFGSEDAANNAKAPGAIEASQINLKSAGSKLVFNHNGSAFVFDTPLTGLGQLEQLYGTTIMTKAVKAAPTESADGSWKYSDGSNTSIPSSPDCKLPEIQTQQNQDSFGGATTVAGGVLVLSDDDVLKGVPSFTVKSGGVLAQPNTTQDLKAVTLADGATLRLAGPKHDGAAAQATDTAIAATWVGGGTVELDTVLGDNSSASDKLVITGSISGITKLKITNLGGVGALTTGDTGILVVRGDGTKSARSFAKADATAFELAGPVSAGGFIYTLKQVDNNWYLVSAAAPTGPVVPVISQVIDDVGASTGDLTQGGTVDSAVTDDTVPTVKGTGATPNSTITLYNNGQPVGTATADANGNWSVEPTTPLAVGSHPLTATETVNGVTSDPSQPFTVIIEAAPGTALPALTIGQVIDDVGPSTGDLSEGGLRNTATTDDTTPTVKGGGATPGATVTLYDNGKPVGSATADASGNWSVEPSVPLANGSHPLTVTQKTDTQPESLVSGVFTVIIESVPGPVSSAVPVPTMSGGALAGLIAMMGLASALVRRRKQKQ